jgi:hypothetical protein
LTIALPLGPILVSASAKRFLEVELCSERCFGIMSEGSHRKLGGKREVSVRKCGSPRHIIATSRLSPV